MTLEDIADLIRANSANLHRRLQELHAESYGQLLNLQNDVTDLRGDVKGVQGGMERLGADVKDLQVDLGAVKSDVAEVRRNLDLAETVAAMRKQIARLEAEVEGLKRRA